MRDCKDTRTRIQKLRELAERGATEGERRAAREALERINEKQAEAKNRKGDAFGDAFAAFSEMSKAICDLEEVFKGFGIR